MHQTIETHNYLRKYSIKPSVQRTAVMQYLMMHKTHPTIDEIYLALSPGMPTLSKTTVYNTLDIFVERGAVKALVIDEKNARYDVDLLEHAHFICRSCGAIHDVYNVKSSLFQIPQNKNFTVDTVEISYSGVCNSCKGN